MSITRVKRNDGTVAWDVRWREGARQRRRRFTRKTDAEQWDRERKILHERGGLPAVQAFTGEGVTLTAWVVEHWGPEHAATLAKTTRIGYTVRWTRWIEPTLGPEKLRDITVSRVRSWQAELLSRPNVSATEVLKARVVLSSILRHAAEAEQIGGNPVGLVKAPKAEHKEEIKPLTPMELELIRARLDPKSRIIHALMAFAGLRPGEVYGLQWGDIKPTTIRVQRSADPDGELKSTKTRSNRSVPIWPALREDLDAWRALQGSTAATTPIIRAADGGHFKNSDAGNWREDFWTPVARDVTGRRPRPYDLRHTCASLMLAEGRTMHYVAKILGHAPTMTMKTYGHVIDELEFGTERVDLEQVLADARATVAAQTRDTTENASQNPSRDPGCHSRVTSNTETTTERDGDTA